MMTGAQFQREVGADAEKWAARFIEAYASASYEAVKTDADRQAFVAAWFADAMDAALSNYKDSEWEV